VTSHVQNDEQPRTVDRRRLVRNAATLAWTVPAIQIATSVPAFAAVSGCCNLSATGSATWRTGDLNYLDISLDITNACSTPVQGLTVMLRICDVKDVTYSGTVFLPNGWSQSGQPNKKLDPVNGCYNLTFTTGTTLAGGATTHATFTAKTMAYVGSGNNRPAGSITALVGTAGCSAAPLPITLPKVG
jgi:hypothetical protein